MENHRSKYAAARLVAAAVAVACGSAAQAQTATPVELQEVVVTATKREARLLDVPVAVTALDGDALADRNLVRIEDFAKSVPGFSLQALGTRGVRPVLRGQNTGGTGASVATMLDDVVLNTASALTFGAYDTPNIDTFDLERVEVLRGPQGTLYGATAQGGLLKYVTRKPDLAAFGAAFELGSDKVEDGETGWSARGMLNLPFAGGKAAVRIVGMHDDVPGFVDNPQRGVKDENSGTRSSGRLSLLWQPTENLAVRLMAFKQEQDFDGTGQIDIVGATFTPNAETDASFRPLGGTFLTRTINPNQFETSYEAYNLVFDYTLGWATFTSSSSLAKLKAYTQADISDAPLGPPGVSLAAFFGAVVYGQPLSLWGRQDNDHDKFNQEFRLASTAPANVFGVPMDWQVGAFYSDEDITFNQYFDAYSLTPPRTLLTVPLPFGGSRLPATYEELAGFGDVTFKFSSRFELSVGGRYTTNDQESQVTNDVGLIGGGPTAIVNPVLKTDESKFTYSFAPRFIVSDDFSIYARVSSGYRPGGPVLPVPGAPPDFPKSFDSDTTKNYELGAKGRLAGGRVTFDVAAFRIDWRDAQVRAEVATSAGTFTVQGNAGEATSQGFEWNLALVPVEGLTIGFNGAWIDAELTQDAPGAGAADGDELPYVPELSTSLDLQYEWRLASGTASAGLTWSHVGKQYSDWSATPAISNHVEIPEYDTLDARLGVAFGRYRLDVFARNLSNEYGLVNYQNTAGFAGAGVGYPIQPRTFGVRFGATF